MMVECDCLGVAGSVALESAGLGASILLCEPEGERRGSASDTGLTRAAISMLAELCGLHKYGLCQCFFVVATLLGTCLKPPAVTKPYRVFVVNGRTLNICN